MPSLWEFYKFWVIWVSCIDRPRTLKEIQRIWDYEGNSLYQRGIEKAIWKEMVEGGFVEKKGIEKKRGVVGTLLYAKMGWIGTYLRSLSTKLKQNENISFQKLLDCIDIKALTSFFEINRAKLFSIDKVKLLFGEKENLKNHYEACILVPTVCVILINAFNSLKKVKMKEDVKFIMTLPFVLNFTSLNFLDYFVRVRIEMEKTNIPRGIIDSQKFFGLWKEYAEKAFG
jgi:hypothetical protein